MQTKDKRLYYLDQDSLAKFSVKEVENPSGNYFYLFYDEQYIGNIFNGCVEYFYNTPKTKGLFTPKFLMMIAEYIDWLSSKPKGEEFEEGSKKYNAYSLEYRKLPNGHIINTPNKKLDVELNSENIPLDMSIQQWRKLIKNGPILAISETVRGNLSPYPPLPPIDLTKLDNERMCSSIPEHISESNNSRNGKTTLQEEFEKIENIQLQTYKEIAKAKEVGDKYKGIFNATETVKLSSGDCSYLNNLQSKIDNVNIHVYENKQECVCSITQLMQTGCKCGFLKKD